MQLVMQLAQPAAQLLAHLRIQRAERLVQQQHLRFHRQRTGQRDALALPAGELRRIAIRQPAQLHQIEQIHHLLADHGLGRALVARLDAETERHVLEHAHMAEQRVMLEDEPHLPFAHMLLRGVLALQQNPAAVGRFQPGDDPEQRGLAAARRAEQRDKLAIWKIERDIAEGGKIPEPLVDAFDTDAHAVVLPAEGVARHSMKAFNASVSSASSASSEATAKAAAN